MPEKCREIKDVWSLSSFLSGGGMIVLQVTVHKSLTLFTRQAQGILLLGSVFSHLRKFLQKEIHTSLRKNLRK